MTPASLPVTAFAGIGIALASGVIRRRPRSYGCATVAAATLPTPISSSMICNCWLSRLVWKFVWHTTRAIVQYLCQLGKAEGGLRGMNTAQADDLVENLGK